MAVGGWLTLTTVPTARRALALIALLAIVALRLEPQLLRFSFIDRGPIGRGMTVYPDRGVEQFPRFLQAVRERTRNGDSIVVVVPMMRWDDGYSYAYYRASYFLTGREVLPLITPENEKLPQNFRAARYLAAFIEEVKASGFVARAIEKHKIRGLTVAPPAKA